jgi:hypothetical protein
MPRDTHSNQVQFNTTLRHKHNQKSMPCLSKPSMKIFKMLTLSLAFGLVLSTNFFIVELGRNLGKPFKNPKHMVSQGRTSLY